MSNLAFSAVQRGTSPSIEIRQISDLPELDRFEEEWHRLAEQGHQPQPFNSHAWVRAYLEHRLHRNERWICLMAFLDGRLIGVLPLIIRRVRRLGVRGVVVATPHDDQTTTVDVLARSGDELTVVPLLINAAMSAAPDCFVLELKRLPIDSPTLAATRRAFRGRELQIASGLGSYLPIGADFSKYRSSLSRNFRSNLSKAANKIATHAVEFTIKRGSAATVDDLDEFMKVEAASWKGPEQTAILRRPDLVRFYLSLTRGLSRAGWLEWHIMRMDGRVIAVNLAIAVRSRLVVWKLGYDEMFSKLSPGSLLFEHVVSEAYANGVTEIDLTSDELWYDNWRMNKRRYQSLEVYPQGLRARLFGYWPRRLSLFLLRVPVPRAITLGLRRLRGSRS